VDVPSLDAVLFLHPRNSVVDVVQSVGRVMRRSEGKSYGYIILPVAVPAGMSPSQALADNQRFKTVWQVLQALRAHDDRFNATVNQIRLNNKAPQNIGIGHVGPGDEAIGDQDGSNTASGQEPKSITEQETEAAQDVQMALFRIDDWRQAIYARLVDKVGERTYWEQWAKDIAAIAQAHVTRIKAALSLPDKRAAFAEFVAELRAMINPGVSEADAIDMLAQHIITKPVFDALFGSYAFAEHNPVSKAMQSMLAALGDQGLEAESKDLQGFYDSVRVRAEGIDNHAGRQQVIVELYDKFFKTDLPKSADALGIVYTPVEVVDFILRAAEQAMARHLGLSLSDEGVHIIDPFVGTGTSPCGCCSPASSSLRTWPVSTQLSCTRTRSCCSRTTSPPSTSKLPTPNWPGTPATISRSRASCSSTPSSSPKGARPSSTAWRYSKATASGRSGRRPSRLWS
jgi:predicted helicase